MAFKELFQKVYNRRNLTVQESQHAVHCMIKENWEPAQIGAFLSALHLKGETSAEIAGFALGMKEMAVAVPSSGKQTMDTCGTGGDQKGSFNISTIVAFVLAGAGIPIYKHGNRAASSSCGSADLLEALGIRCRLRPEETAEAIEKTGFAFLFAPDYHPATRSVAAIRRLLGVPTIFNLLGPLTNPANPSAQLIGVYDGRVLPCLANAIRTMDPERRATLVHSLDGWDEATTCCDFFLYPSTGETRRLNASNFGFSLCSPDSLRGGSPKENARIALGILNGEKGPRRENVLLNAMLAAMIFYPEMSQPQALELVTDALDSGSAMQVVIKLKNYFPGEAA